MRLKLELIRTRPLIRTTNTFFLFSYNGYVSLNTKPSISFHVCGKVPWPSHCLRHTTQSLVSRNLQSTFELDLHIHRSVHLTKPIRGMNIWCLKVAPINEKKSKGNQQFFIIRVLARYEGFKIRMAFRTSYMQARKEDLMRSTSP